MAKLQTGTRIFGTANVDSTLVVGGVSPQSPSVSSTSGTLQVGSGLSFSDTGIVASFTSNTNSYSQIVNQNFNSGTLASTDYIVNNDLGSASVIYGDFGINSSKWNNIGSPFGVANATYLYAAGGQLTVGTTNAFDYVIATNGTTVLTASGTNGNINVVNTLVADQLKQTNNKVAIGGFAGENSQNAYSVAIGNFAGQNNQGLNSVAIGPGAGKTNQGDSSVAIGGNAGFLNQPYNSIIINSGVTDLNSVNSGLYINPIRNDVANTTQALYYDTSTKELTYAPSSVATANNALANTGSLITVNSASQLSLANTTQSTSNATGSLVIAGGVGVQKTLWVNKIILDSGTLTVAPLGFNAGTNLTTPVSGAVEYDGNTAFLTTNTTVGTGRGILLSPQFGRLATSASVASGGAFFTATIRPQLQQGQYYHFRYYLAWNKVTAGTLTYSFTASTGTFVYLQADARTYVQGAVLAAVTNMASIFAISSSPTTSTASASIANNANGYTIIEGFVVPATNCRLSLLVTTSAGTITSALGSNFLVTALGAVNIGNIA